VLEECCFGVVMDVDTVDEEALLSAGLLAIAI
jgi:hypothetical protein